MTVKEPVLISSLAVSLIGIDEHNTATVNFQLPLLPQDCKGVYLYYSSDKENWSKISTDEKSLGNNFLQKSIPTGQKQIITHQYSVLSSNNWFYIEIIGSGYEGVSNIVSLDLSSYKEISAKAKEEDNRNGGEWDKSGGASAEENVTTKVSVKIRFLSEADFTTPTITLGEGGAEQKLFSETPIDQGHKNMKISYTGKVLDEQNSSVHETIFQSLDSIKIKKGCPLKTGKDTTVIGNMISVADWAPARFFGAASRQQLLWLLLF